MGHLREPSNLYISASAEDTPARLPSTTTTAVTQSLISQERWAVAEKATCQIICKVLPTDVSGKTRRGIIDYIYRLIKTRTGCEVFPYGSVPLKTYLPDGDIDLTAFGGAFSEDLLADEIVSLLERDDRNENREFIVKDVQLIRAEVKIVKCIVQNVVVDISLNQIGGLCTLCFLEQVDRLIGKDHLFKRSIILIKTWCYYESRILGAPHGLISTYALETLVLYIFNLYHSSLDSPLAVLYKFLDHFSKFDWDNYAISINGPVRLISFPDLTAENGGVDLLLSTEFLRKCVEMYSLPSRGGDFNSRVFQQKHLNIIDPLKENNNLGRSVSKGNFYRIRSAFTFGARKLASILMQQEHDLNEDLKKFFSNTLERHGCRPRPDVHGPQIFHPETEPSPKDISIPESKSTFYIGAIDACSSTQNGSDHESQRESDRLSGNVVNQRTRMSGDAKDHSSGEAKKPNINTFSLPHRYIIKPSASSESKSENSNNCGNNTGKSCVSNGVDSNGVENDHVNKDKILSSGGSKAFVSETMSLTGDYETYVHCLQYARLCIENASGVPPPPPPPLPPLPPPPPPPLFLFNNQWVAAVQHSSLFNMNGFSHNNVNGVIPASPFYTINPRLVPGMHFGSEDIQKPRGTGTYFPNPVPLNRVGQMFNRPPPTLKERYITASRTPGTGRGGMFIETNNTIDHNTRNQSQSEETVEQLSRVMISPINNQQSFSPHPKGHLNSNGFALHSEGSLDFVPKEASPPVLERNRQLQHKDFSFLIPKASPISPTGKVLMDKAVDNEEDVRIPKKSSYQLKDDDDFPPLSS